MLLYFFLALPCALLTTKSAISEFSAFFTFLFLIFEAPNLNIFGILSMPLFISFLPDSEPNAFAPRSNPAFTKFEPSPIPV